MQKKSIILIICFLIASSFITHSQVVFAKSKSEIQEDFFEFSTGIYKWAAYFSSLRKSDTENISEIYFKITEEKLNNLEQFFRSHKHVMYALNYSSDLHQIHNIDIVPQSIYEFIKDRFSIKNSHEKLEKSQLFIKLMGGDFDFGNEKTMSIESILDRVEAVDINNWLPVKKFIRNFQDTLAQDSRLSHQLGKTLLPLAQFYYQYMDVISRLRLFKELASDAKYIDIRGQDRASDIDNVSINIFQNSGPVMIKLLQQLQEEIVGDSPLTKVLSGLKDTKPMNVRKAEYKTRSEIQRLLGFKINDFTFKKDPLGVASIAQTHLITFNGINYVVKIRKDKIKEVFTRERLNLKKMVSEEEIFDKGMKQKIENTNKGIYEELDFNFERKNVNKAQIAYHSTEDRIFSINNPSRFYKKDRFQNCSEDIMILSHADGEALGSLMKRADVDELKKAYLAVQRLYSVFLSSALNPEKPFNFYHGDLHRENIFYDAKFDNLYLIDFGNAGELDEFMRESILNIFYYTKQTQTQDEAELDQAIIDLGKILQDFVLKYQQNSSKFSDVTRSITKSFFNVCFNPHGKVHNKVSESRELTVKKDELESNLSKFKMLLSKHENMGNLKSKLDLVQSDIDYIKALLGNCLNGPTNPLLSALASDALISDKLNIVFQELLKNGIAMPTEVIFFNKSKSLLEGILNNFVELLDQSGADYIYVEPDNIYNSILDNINK